MDTPWQESRKNWSGIHGLPARVPEAPERLEGQGKQGRGWSKGRGGREHWEGTGRCLGQKDVCRGGGKLELQCRVYREILPSAVQLPLHKEQFSFLFPCFGFWQRVPESHSLVRDGFASQ